MYVAPFVIPAPGMAKSWPGMPTAVRPFCSAVRSPHLRLAVGGGLLCTPWPVPGHRGSRLVAPRGKQWVSWGRGRDRGPACLLHLDRLPQGSGAGVSATLGTENRAGVSCTLQPAIGRGLGGVEREEETASCWRRLPAVCAVRGCPGEAAGGPVWPAHCRGARHGPGAALCNKQSHLHTLSSGGAGARTPANHTGLSPGDHTGTLGPAQPPGNPQRCPQPSRSLQQVLPPPPPVFYPHPPAVPAWVPPPQIRCRRSTLPPPASHELISCQWLVLPPWETPKCSGPTCTHHTAWSSSSACWSTHGPQQAKAAPGIRHGE